MLAFRLHPMTLENAPNADLTMVNTIIVRLEPTMLKKEWTKYATKENCGKQLNANILLSNTSQKKTIHYTMKDKLFKEIEESSIVARVNYSKTQLAIVRGGNTNGGQIRIVDLVNGHKSSAKPHHLIVLSNESAIELAQGLLEEWENKMQQNPYPIDQFTPEENDRAIARYENAINSYINNLNSLIRIINQGGSGNDIQFQRRNNY